MKHAAQKYQEAVLRNVGGFQTYITAKKKLGGAHPAADYDLKSLKHRLGIRQSDGQFDSILEPMLAEAGNSEKKKAKAQELVESAKALGAAIVEAVKPKFKKGTKQTASA